MAEMILNAKGLFELPPGSIISMHHAPGVLYIKHADDVWTGTHSPTTQSDRQLIDRSPWVLVRRGYSSEPEIYRPDIVDAKLLDIYEAAGYRREGNRVILYGTDQPKPFDIVLRVEPLWIGGHLGAYERDAVRFRYMPEEHTRSDLREDAEVEFTMNVKNIRILKEKKSDG